MTYFLTNDNIITKLLLFVRYVCVIQHLPWREGFLRPHKGVVMPLFFLS